MSIPVSAVRWQPCYRIIPSRFPPIELFEAVADPADLEAVFRIEAMTNDRLREEVGELTLVPAEDRVAGPGTSPIMAAFTHLNPAGDRFTDGSYGVFYASLTIETAIAETRHHRTRFLAATEEPAQEIDVRVYAVDLDADLHDIRAMRDSHPAYYHPTSYAVSQDLGRALRDAGSDGVVYASVRDEGGECAAVFRPRLLSNCRQERHLCYVWDGRAISTIYEKKSLD
ncbi:RES domain-containing protein [Aurantiacibacter xanthus]|uniref:RES domain-containing protein n=1 Tax=Aurantiacibacter xanthus TaxID=1784712 RepID=A0A3A1PGA1_9SPHN|nr:RES domain-containing protein [Aurantiacibacter xanthus]